jgi:hypothetical protein
LLIPPPLLFSFFFFPFSVAVDGPIDFTGNDGTTGPAPAKLYNIRVLDEILNGTIIVNPEKAKSGDTITITAFPADASKWAGQEAAPEKLSGGGGGNNNYPWYVTDIRIYVSGSPILPNKVAVNQWTFHMPFEGDVEVSGTFSQSPPASAYLAILDVSVSSTITHALPALICAQKNYTAEIPYIEEGSEFSIIAKPEDPLATVTITPLPDGDPESDSESWVYDLPNEETVYKITVSRDGALPSSTEEYTFTVKYNASTQN